jgi:hypothetical protein|tara:strand:- start:4082 stop:5566 length:1485 start_codon:yes stop_codon:yes gene_type:complete
MADKNLILGARLAAGGFNKGLAEAVDKSIAKTTDSVVAAIKAERDYRNLIDSRAINILNQFPPEIEFSKVDDLHREALSPVALAQKQKYADIANKLATMSPRDPEYVNLSTELNKIKQNYQNANTNLIDLQAKRAEWNANRGEVSLGFDTEKTRAFDAIFAPGGSFSVTYDDNMNAQYTVEGYDGVLTNSDFNWYQKDKEFLQQIDPIIGTALQAGIKGLEYKDDSSNYYYSKAKRDISNLFTGADAEDRILSILKDKDMFAGIPLYEDGDPELAEILNNPTSQENKEKVVQKLLDHAVDINQDHYKKYLSTLGKDNDNDNDNNLFSNFTQAKQQEITLAYPKIQEAFKFATNNLDNDSIARQLKKLDINNEFLSDNDFFEIFISDPKAAAELVGISTKKFNKLTDEEKRKEFNKINSGRIFDKNQNEIPIDNTTDLFKTYLRIAGVSDDIIDFYLNNAKDYEIDFNTNTTNRQTEGAGGIFGILPEEVNLDRL